MEFKILARDNKSNARRGILHTGHGDINTPIFMPVGTLGTVKGVHYRDLTEEIKAQIVLSNTYHLYLRPGTEVIKAAGGLHKFAGINLPILTDSGGYQVFSLSEKRKITNEGVLFQSHIDGSRHLFTPENVVDTQRILGSDIMMAFDECTAYPVEKDEARKSMLLTHKWLERGWQQFVNTSPLWGHQQAYFPIVQGSVYEDLRKESAQFISSFPADGYAIGGLSVGEPAEMMYEMITIVNNILPDNKPRYLMGVGTPANILEAVERGVDMFDCVMPTRNGRNGMLFTYNGIINIKNEKWKYDFSPIDPNGTAFVDTHYSKAYLRHLMVSNEMLGAQIASIHNLAFYLKLVEDIRLHIEKGDFVEWKNTIIDKVQTRL